MVGKFATHSNKALRFLFLHRPLNLNTFSFEATDCQNYVPLCFLLLW